VLIFSARASTRRSLVVPPIAGFRKLADTRPPISLEEKCVRLYDEIYQGGA
jgi:hypothetical protein